MLFWGSGVTRNTFPMLAPSLPLKLPPPRPGLRVPQTPMQTDGHSAAEDSCDLRGRSPQADGLAKGDLATEQVLRCQGSRKGNVGGPSWPLRAFQTLPLRNRLVLSSAQLLLYLWGGAGETVSTPESAPPTL